MQKNAEVIIYLGAFCLKVEMNGKGQVRCYDSVFRKQRKMLIMYIGGPSVGVGVPMIFSLFPVESPRKTTPKQAFEIGSNKVWIRAKP